MADVFPDPISEHTVIERMNGNLQYMPLHLMSPRLKDAIGLKGRELIIKTVVLVRYALLNSVGVWLTLAALFANYSFHDRVRASHWPLGAPCQYGGTANNSLLSLRQLPLSLVPVFITLLSLRMSVLSWNFNSDFITRVDARV